MSYFPAYLKFDNKKILIIGGGSIACDKLTHLLDFTKDISILSIAINDKIKKLSSMHNIQIISKRYNKNDIDGFDIIIIAANDIELQKKIYDEAREKKILCNAVDSVEFCDFIFPSYIKKGDLNIAVSTSGASPAVAKYLRKYIEKFLPKNIDEFLQKMKYYRKTLPKGVLRMKFLDEKAKRYFNEKGKIQ